VRKTTPRPAEAGRGRDTNSSARGQKFPPLKPLHFCPLAEKIILKKIDKGKTILFFSIIN